jgi:hypothetical protein
MKAPVQLRKGIAKKIAKKKKKKKKKRLNMMDCHHI